MPVVQTFLSGSSENVLIVLMYKSASLRLHSYPQMIAGVVDKQCLFVYAAFLKSPCLHVCFATFTLYSSPHCVHVPVLEVGVDHPVGEALAANTDSFKHTVTGELVHHKVRVNHTCEEQRRRYLL